MYKNPKLAGISNTHSTLPTTEFSLISADSQDLYGKAWVPESTLGIVCLIHGLGEHIGRYQHVAEHLNKHGLAVYAYDQKGHGKSSGKRGHALQENLWDDVESLMKKARSQHLEAPMFLYGHSWGGNVVSNFILRRNTGELKGVVLSSPWLRLSFEPPAWQLALGQLMARVYPAFTQSNGLNVEHLSRDQAVGHFYKNDPLVHDKISAGLFLGTLSSGQYALNHAGEIKLPVLTMHGTDDQITSPGASKEFATSGGDNIDLKLWPDMRHETHNELGKEEVLEYVSTWVLNHLD